MDHFDLKHEAATTVKAALEMLRQMFPFPRRRMGYIQLAAAKYRGGVDAGEEEGAVVQVAAAASRSAPAR